MKLTSVFIVIFEMLFLNLINLQADENSASVEYMILRYESLEMDKLKLCKQVLDGSNTRSVYFDSDQGLFIKLWGADYPHAKQFQRALACNFYEGIAPLKAVIYDKNGTCRGYVTVPCKMASDVELVNRPLFESNQYGFVRFQSMALQPSIFKNFYDDFLTIISKTGMVYLDFVPGNIAIDQNHYVLLDLEGVYLADELAEFRRNRPGYFDFVLKSLPIEYSQLVEDFLEKSILQ